VNWKPLTKRRSRRTGSALYVEKPEESVKVISNKPGKLRALEEAGLEIVERVSIEVEASEPAAKYLQTKKEKLGHLLGL